MTKNAIHRQPITQSIAYKGGGPQGNKQVGMNLYYHDFYSSLFLFNDFAKQRAEPATGQNAFLANDVGVGFDAQGHYPAGVYVLTWSGAGVTWSNKGDGAIQNITANRLEVNVVTKSNTALWLRWTAGTPTNIKLWAPGMEATAEDIDAGTGVFHATPITWLTPFKGGIRTLEARRVNTSHVTTFTTGTAITAEAATTDLQTTSKGISVAYAVALANTLNVDLYLNIKHQYTDASIDALASYVLAHLKTGLRWICEVSNEPFNAVFGGGAAWQGTYDVNAQYDYYIKYGVEHSLGGQNPGYSGIRGYAVKAALAFNRVKAIWASSLSRLVCVMNMQFGGPGSNAPTDPNGIQFDCAHFEYDGVNEAITAADAICIAPYYPGESTLTDPGLLSKTPAQIQAASLAFINGFMSQRIGEYRDWAASLGKILLGYEGGQSYQPQGQWSWNQAAWTLWGQCADDIGQYALTKSYLDAWAGASGGATMFWFASAAKHGGQSGNWGLGQWQDTTLSSKTQNPQYVGATDWITEHSAS